MLKVAQSSGKLFAIPHYTVALRAAGLRKPLEVARFGVDVALEAERQIDFLGFDDQVRPDQSQEFCGIGAGREPLKLNARVGVSQIMSVGVNAPTECEQAFNDGLVRHTDASEQAIANVSGAGFLPLRDANKAFAVEQSRDVSSVHVAPLGVAEKVANSGNIRCPARKGAEGQSRAKQRESAGVCNEHVPPAKAKMCSELGGNVERSAEMTGPSDVNHDTEFTSLVTDCNTDYIFLRYATRRLFKPLERVQSINQDAIVQLITFAGNMTTSNASLQGVLKA